MKHNKRYKALEGEGFMDLSKLEDLAEQITPGPWRSQWGAVFAEPGEVLAMGGNSVTTDEYYGNANFVVAVRNDIEELLSLARLGFELQQDSEAYAAFNAKRFNKSMANIRERMNMNIEVKKLEPTDRQLNLIQSVGVFEGDKLIATFVRLDDADLFAVMKRKEMKALAERTKENT